MQFTMNLAGQVNNMHLPKSKALWPLFETIVNSIQSLEDIMDCDAPKIVIMANRPKEMQTNLEGEDELNHFEEFIVQDNGEGFSEKNYTSFLEAYSTLKVKKGCKGIGRFLWLKAFKKVEIHSIYLENGEWFEREFSFTLSDAVIPENNKKKVNPPETQKNSTEVRLLGFLPQYRETVALSLESLVKKIIDHCLPYFIMGGCPQIILRDNLGDQYVVNDYYNRLYRDSLHRDEIKIKDQDFILYHMTVHEGADKHELHLCANNREVKSIDLSKLIPNLDKKIVSGDDVYYYVGYLTGDYLDKAVDLERYEFCFEDNPILYNIDENEIVNAAISFIEAYLSDDLDQIREDKKQRIDEFVRTKKPQYRFLLNRKPEIYDSIHVGLSDEKLDMELYEQEQKWERDIAQSKAEIDERRKQNATDNPSFKKLFGEYCESVTQLSQASLAEYVVRRKAVIALLEEALQSTEDGTYKKEAQIHSIICPMQITSDDVKFEDMNLWLIDDRLAYHQFLASDQPMKSLPVLQSDVPRRMDIAIFDRAISYSADEDNINSITIVELKKPQRDDMKADNKNPIRQVLQYVQDIKDGKVKKANGRGFGPVQNAQFYCYVIADLTESLIYDAKMADFNPTPDGEGYFGYHSRIGAYVEVISYDKLVKDAKKRNEVLFDKLFHPKANELISLYKSDDKKQAI